MKSRPLTGVELLTALGECLDVAYCTLRAKDSRLIGEVELANVVLIVSSASLLGRDTEGATTLCTSFPYRYRDGCFITRISPSILKLAQYPNVELSACEVIGNG